MRSKKVLPACDGAGLTGRGRGDTSLLLPASPAALAGYASVVRGSEVCTQRPHPSFGVVADIVRASELQHAVEDVDRHVNFSHPTFAYT
jgi:hypothetical protein